MFRTESTEMLSVRLTVLPGRLSLHRPTSRSRTSAEVCSCSPRPGQTNLDIHRCTSPVPRCPQAKIILYGTWLSRTSPHNSHPLPSTRDPARPNKASLENHPTLRIAPRVDPSRLLIFPASRVAGAWAPARAAPVSTARCCTSARPSKCRLEGVANVGSTLGFI